MMDMYEKPDVSVCMTAYNQEGMIGQAIEGVLMQKADLRVELVIGDDYSTDGTEDICRRYAEKFPHIIRYHRRDRNFGMMLNFLQTLSECNGKYIAWCEGDDYWIDDDKLHLQYELLENQPELSMACHNHSVLRNGYLSPGYPEITEPYRTLTTRDYLLNPHFQTASYFFRRSALPQPFPPWYSDVLAGDHFLVLLLSLKGDIGFINRRMSVFRTYETSVTGTRGPLAIKENFVRHLRFFDRETDHEFKETIEFVIKKWDLGYKVYESGAYFSKLTYFIRQFPFYFMNFRTVGGPKLAAKYILSISLYEKLKRRRATH